MIVKKKLSDIRHIMIRMNPLQQSMSTIKANEVPHGICNASLFNPDFTPCANALWVNGVKQCSGNYPGYALGSGLTWGSGSATYSGDFIGGYPSYENGSFPTTFTDLQPTVKLKRAALARSSTDLIYYASTSANFDDIESALSAEGAINGINLDGGGSLQYDFGTPYTSTRIVPDFLMFWFKDQTMPTRRRGDSGWVVTEIQRLLTQKGYSTTVDGSFGPATEANVKLFQSANSLTPDGIIGPLTWAKLDA